MPLVNFYMCIWLTGSIIRRTGIDVLRRIPARLVGMDIRSEWITIKFKD